MSDISSAISLIMDHRPDYEKAEAYYDGKESEVFLHQRWYRLLKSNGVDFKFNFTRTVVDSVLNRLEIANIMGTSESGTNVIKQTWEQNDMLLDQDEIHRKALTYGDCYVIVWPDETGTVTINYNSPLNTVIIYDEENPRIKKYAAKVWQMTETNGSKSMRLNLYYPDRIEKYESVAGDLDVLNQQTIFTLIETVENPWNEIPVFHFRTQKQYGRPEHFDGYGPQDAVNKLIATHMYTVDYQGAPQRYALGFGGNGDEYEDFNEDSVKRDNLGSLQNGPGQLWFLKGVDKVGQFDPADHKAFTEPTREYVRAMASLTNTPLHYFERTGNVPSGEALRTAEAPLMKKVHDRQQSFGSAWRDLFRFVLRIEGIIEDVEVKWKHVESIDSLDQWEVGIKKKLVGLPVEQILLEMGYDEEIARQLASEANTDLDISQNNNTSNLIRQENAEQAEQR
jgi:hypothetical protein